MPASRPSFLPLDTLTRASSARFDDKVSRDIWDLEFSHKAETDIGDLSALIDVPEMPQIEIPDAAPMQFDESEPSPFSPTQQTAPAPLPVVTTPMPTISAPKPWTPQNESPEIPGPEQSPNGTPISVPAGAPQASTAPPPPGGTLRAKTQTHATPYLGLIEQIATEMGEDPALVAAIMDTEQSGASSVSPAGARGLMQVVPGQGFDHPGEDASDPATSIRQGIRTIKEKRRILGPNATNAQVAGAYFGYGTDAGGMSTGRYQQRYQEMEANYERVAPSAPQSARGGGVQNPEQANADAVAQSTTAFTRNQGEAGTALGLPWSTTLEICGPVAAAAFLRKNGRLPGREEAEAMRVAQEKGYWQPGRGMGGPTTTSALLTDLGVANKLEDGVDWEKIKADVRRGNPVIVDTSGHLFVVEGYDEKTGKFNFGESAKFL
jgi:hypothetical protein